MPVGPENTTPMEDLALLCTLHADGPATLRRLRRAGCETLAELESYDPHELAGILCVAPAVARRLGREARTLSRRLGVGVFEDREEAPESAVDAPLDSVADTIGASAALDRRDRAILGKVLERWSREPGAERRELRPERRSGGDRTPPSPPAGPPPRPAIPAGSVDGLDPRLSERLAALGIGDLSALAAAEPLALARDLGLPFAQVRRLQFLARASAPRATGRTVGGRAEAEGTGEAAAEALRVSPVDEDGEAVPPEPLPQGAPFRPAWPSAARLASGAGPGVGPAPAPAPEARSEAPGRKFWEPHVAWVSGDAPPEPLPLPPDAPISRESPPQASRREGTTLGWTFEVPRPVPRAAAPAPDPRPAPLERGDEGEFHEGDAAGPFA